MDAHPDRLSQQVAALTDRLTNLGTKLAEAARELQDSGAPPSDSLVEDLARAREAFVQLSGEVLALAESLDVATSMPVESARALEEVLARITAAIAARRRKAALDEARNGVLRVLDRVGDIVHRDEREFAPLMACHDKARELRAAVMALTELEDARRLTDDIRAFCDFLTIVESDGGLNDARYAQLEGTVVRVLGTPLAVAAARGRLCFSADVPLVPPAPPPAAPEPVPAPEPVVPMLPPPDVVVEAPPADTAPAEAVAVEPPVAEGAEPALVAPAGAAAADVQVAPPLEPAAGPPVAAPVAPAGEPAAAPEPAASEDEETAAEPSGPDETAQWWLAASARWSGWKANVSFADAVKEELAKYPYLLSVPIQKSPEYDDGLAAYGYSIVMAHIEKQNPGCVDNALNSLRAGQRRPLGDQLYDYLVTQGRLAETYGDFVKSVVVAAVPEPGLWFQCRILETRDATRVLQRPSGRVGDIEISGKRLAADAQRFTEHKFAMSLPPLTSRFVQVSADLAEPRGVGVKVTADGTPVDQAWLVMLPASRTSTRYDSRRVTAEGTGVANFGRDYSAIWIALFNADPAVEKRFEVGVTLRKDGRAPFGARKAAS